MIYFVSPTGNDNNFGTSKTQAWKSLGRVNSADLHAGDKVLFKRQGVWMGTLEVPWLGTASNPITIGAYGKGSSPVIRNGPNDALDKFHINVKVSGSHLILEYLETTIINPPVVPDCENNPVGWCVGVNFVGKASNNLLRYSKASGHTAGVHMHNTTQNNRVLHSVFVNNNVMQVLDEGGGANDIGAWGALIKGSNHEIAYCYFAGNNALCGYDTVPQGNSVELYEAKNCVIHHNQAWGDRVFSELGSTAPGVSPKIITENNLYAYNLVVSSIQTGKFITTRGPNADFGPVKGTRLFHNTVYLTGSESQAFNCGGGCDFESMEIKNNIFWAEWKAGYFSDKPPDESNNIYWSTDGTPFIQGYNISPTSKKANPLFVNPAAGDFHLKAGSPAINAGMDFGWTADFDGTLVPQGPKSDIGAYEFVPVS